jgi:hypothetical protein
MFSIKKYFKKFKCWRIGHDLTEIDRGCLIVKCMCNNCAKYYAYSPYGVFKWDAQHQEAIEIWKSLEKNNNMPF